MRKPVVIAWRLNRGKVVSLDKKFWLNAISIASRNIPIFVGSVIFTLNPGGVAGVTTAGILAETFKPGGVGGTIVQMLVIAAFGTLSTYITSALGQGQISSMIKLGTVFSCIGLCISLIWGAIEKVATYFRVVL